MVQFEKSFTSSPYLTGQTQLQITYNPSYPDIGTGQWGIDTVHITFQVGTNDYDPGNGWKATTQPDGTLTRLTQYIVYQKASIYISINVLRGWCFVSFNAARLIHEDRLCLLDPDLFTSEIQKLLVFLFPYVSSLMIWNKHQNPLVLNPNWQEHVYLQRLDIAANLENLSKQTFHDLKMAKIPRQNKLMIIESPSGVQTICMFTKGEGQRKIYDKSTELWKNHEIFTPYQVHRFESQLQSSRLDPLKNLALINRTYIWQLLKQHWEEAGFRLHNSSDQLKDAIKLLYPRIGARIILHLENKSAGKMPAFTKPTTRKYERIIADTEKLINPQRTVDSYLELENLIKKQPAIRVNSLGYIA